MVAEVQRQTFAEIVTIYAWVLALVVDVHMRLAGVATVSTAPHDFSFLDSLPSLSKDAARLEMGQKKKRP